jgi:hypothetical protein
MMTIPKKLSLPVNELSTAKFVHYLLEYLEWSLNCSFLVFQPLNLTATVLKAHAKTYQMYHSDFSSSQRNVNE